MKNLLDYVKEYKNKSFDIEPFNKFDGMVFARLSYVDYRNFVSSGKFHKYKLNDIIKAILSNNNYKNLAKPNDLYLMSEMFYAPRYKNIYLKFHVNKFCEESTKQFSATTFYNKSKKNKFYIVSYRGTDGTTVGWKEDFNMSLDEEVPAQKEAMEYIEKLSSWGGIDNFIFVGHSKGGNLAVYGASALKNKHCVNKIFLYDSPGFSKNFVDSQSFRDIQDKIICYIPYSSIIGRLLLTPYTMKIVKSDKKLLSQHSVYNWFYENEDLIYIDKNSSFSNFIISTIQKNLKTIDMDQRRKFIDVTFDLLEEVSETPIKDIYEDFFGFMKKFKAKTKELDEEEKKIITSTFKLFIKDKTPKEIEEDF